MYLKINLFFILFLFLCSPFKGISQSFEKEAEKKHTITWTGVSQLKVNDVDSISFISFNNAIYKNNLPYYLYRINLSEPYSYTAAILNENFIECTLEEEKVIEGSYLTEEFQVVSEILYEKKEPVLGVSILPIRKNPFSGKYEKLISFQINLTKNSLLSTERGTRIYATNSVLATGKWYKIGVSQNGIFKLTYEDLTKLGMDVSSINPKNIRIYGNGGGILPENNFIPRHDDLIENAIFVSGELDNKFNSDDYILFYGESPKQWNYNPSQKKSFHQTNYYSNYTYYFICADLGPGKRITQQASVSAPANKFVSKFNDYLCHEKDSFNLIISGKEWYGELFDIQTAYTFQFSFPSIDINSKVFLRTDIASRYGAPSSYKINADGNTFYSMINASSSTNVYANSSIDSLSFYPSGSPITITITKNTTNAIGWLNFIELNAVRNLALSEPQLIFRNYETVGIGNISEYTITNFSSTSKIWDITDPHQIKEQLYLTAGNNGVFSAATDTLKTFVAFTGQTYYSPNLIGLIANQNLHGLPLSDFIIITHPDFVSQANEIANIHSTHDNLSSVIVTPNQIYNEFSSGMQDVSAIRDFIKMFYDRAQQADEMPKYLLLFGDASYDYKDRISKNTNFVPTFQSYDGLGQSVSWCSDDFFGFLDNTEGAYVSSLLDIGIGRFPVTTTTEANTMVQKVRTYLEKNNPLAINNSSVNYTSTPSGDWRNTVCFIADDEDGNIFFSSSESIANEVDTSFNLINIDKIYSDSYIQETGAGGQRYPQVNESINNRVGKGALIINYIGHGGETGWSLERILQVTDIQSWKNIKNMPLFLTATCEFSRYDDPSRTSAGEYVLLNKSGGGIALLTTSRLAFSNSNHNYNTRFFEHVFKLNEGKYPTLGELNMLSKNSGLTVDYQIRNFVLLGDPALRLSYPENKVITTQINGHPVGTIKDTLNAFNHVTVSGIIQNTLGEKLTNFNGVVYPSVYDKKTITTTLGNDPGSYPATYNIQKSILYKGKVSVINGEFTFSFIVPKDISYNYGVGRISYYAEDGQTNANGYYENEHFIIGGTSNLILNDSKGPDMELYLNDTNFVFGGTTDENPVLIAHLNDISGINTAGNGIGHDIVAVIDDNTDRSVVLNDYYEADLDSYQTGKVRYPFAKLSDGMHTLKLKVWDIYNNSSEKIIEFIVAESGEIALTHVLNYPNPFTTNTSFYFEHNQSYCEMDVKIEIFTISGKLIKTIDKKIQTMGFRPDPIPWDGLDEFGDPIGKGVYIYKLKVKDENGKTAEKIEKLVIIR